MIRLPLRSLLQTTRCSSSSLISKTFIRLSSTGGSSVPSSPGYPVAVPVESKDTTNIAETVVPQSELQKNQAPNRSTTWSRSQRPRSSAMVGPRFEQTDLEVQVCGIEPFLLHSRRSLLYDFHVSHVFVLLIYFVWLNRAICVNHFEAFTNIQHSQDPMQPLNSHMSNQYDGHRTELLSVMEVVTSHVLIFPIGTNESWRTYLPKIGGGPAGHPKVFINVDKPEVVTCNYCSLPFVCYPIYLLSQHSVMLLLYLKLRIVLTPSFTS